MSFLLWVAISSACLLVCLNALKTARQVRSPLGTVVCVSGVVCNAAAVALNLVLWWIS